MRACQIEAITKLEASFAADRPRALIQMATGAGKTFTACAATYRLIKYAGARRVLFLVDRANLGRQAVGEFQLRHPRQRPQVHRALQRPAPHQQRSSTTSPASPSAPSSASTRILRGEELARRPRRTFRRRPRRRRRPAPEGSRLQPRHPHRSLRLHRHRRVPPLHLQPLAAGARILRRLPHRPHRHARPSRPSASSTRTSSWNTATSTPSPTASTSATTSTASRPRSPRPAAPSKQGFVIDKRRPRAPAPSAGNSSTKTSPTPPTELDRAVVVPDQIRTVLAAFRDALFTELFPGRTLGAQDPHLRQGRLPRRGHRPHRAARSSARATTSAKRSPTRPSTPSPASPPKPRSSSRSSAPRRNPASPSPWT